MNVFPETSTNKQMYLRDLLVVLSTNKRMLCWHVPLFCMPPAAWPVKKVQTGVVMSQCQLGCQLSCTPLPLTRLRAAFPDSLKWVYPSFIYLSSSSSIYNCNNSYPTYAEKCSSTLDQPSLMPCLISPTPLPIPEGFRCLRLWMYCSINLATLTLAHPIST